LTRRAVEGEETAGKIFPVVSYGPALEDRTKNSAFIGPYVVNVSDASAILTVTEEGEKDVKARLMKELVTGIIKSEE